MVVSGQDMGTKPSWLRIRPPKTEQYTRVRSVLQKFGLVTVCGESHCPNMSECWDHGTATFMLLGDTCTRSCRFCNTKSGSCGQPVDHTEPQRLVHAVKELGIFDYIVITSVDRDDLPDLGARHIASCISALHKAGLQVEALVPDFQARKECIQAVCDAGATVLAHNVETVQRLQHIRDRRAGYEQSLTVLSLFKECNPQVLTKSAILVGMGETDEEVIETMKDLRQHHVDLLTIGQYLRPSQSHTLVVRYVTPEQFSEYAKIGKELGFRHVASGPFVRSSYRAGETTKKHLVEVL